MKNALILLAGGKGERLKNKEPKQFIKIGGTTLIDYFLSNLDSSFFEIIVIAINKKNKKKYINSLIKNYKQHKIIFSQSGNCRQLSSYNSLKLLNKYKPKNVLIHDCARPLVSNQLIKKILDRLNKSNNCIPYLSFNDLIKSKKNPNLINKDIMSIQTPQGFDFKRIYYAHQISKLKNFKDDSTIFENIGEKLIMIKGEYKNIKITYKEDLNIFKEFKKKEYRSGIGYDIHKIDHKSKKNLTLCGVKIKHPPLIGHSDADVGYHAVCDSILGALSMKDIGYYFNNKNKKWKNANSSLFVKFCSNQLINNGYKIINLDINFICEEPNIRNLSKKMKKNLSKLLKISLKNISIKATTNEKISFIGNKEGIAAESIVQITNV